MSMHMASRAVVAASVVVGGCSSSLDPAFRTLPDASALETNEERSSSRSVFREDGSADAPTLTDGSSADDYVRYALFHSPAVEEAYQRWRVASERIPQVSALPDPRLSVGFFLDEVETRTGAQQARVGVSQSFPWPGLLQGREDVEILAARAAWSRFDAARLEVTARVVTALHELAYLDASARIAAENLDLLSSFEDVVRARYRVGAGSHPELVRVQVELGLLDDRLQQIRAMRPAMVASLNAALGRPTDAAIASVPELPGRLAVPAPAELAEMAMRSNPSIRALAEQADAERARTEVARREGRPSFSVGLDYIVTDDAMDPSIPESGDDPIFLNLGLSLPVWRGKYEAGVRESIARRLATTHARSDAANGIAASIGQAWFEHTDADRRARLYERTLIPKAEESLRASLASFRAGETSFLDLLDTERTLLEFLLAIERAHADRGQALARLQSLVGEPIPTIDASTVIQEDRP
ncbi:MAG: TolC family protein [Phycisphaerales bacterium]|nr:TolC family protein [Phycisphaerales bacterium]